MFTMIKSVRPPTEFVPAVLLCALCPIVPAVVEAQAPASSTSETRGGFPDASFDAAFRKYMPPKNKCSMAVAPAMFDRYISLLDGRFGKATSRVSPSTGMGRSAYDEAGFIEGWRLR
jgi:hypothetical protein